MKWPFLLCSFWIFFTSCNDSDHDRMRDEFQNPPHESRPGSFWCWLNGNMTKESITRDLEDMQSKGMGSAGLWDVAAISNPEWIPAGEPFLEDESVELIQHAVSEGNRLDMTVGMIASSGWNAGGSWVTPDWASKSLFFSDTLISGGRELNLLLPFPILPAGCPKNPDSTPVFSKEIAVLALPANSSKEIQDINEVRDVSSNFKNGRLVWDAPAGDWVLLRFICSNNGQRLIVPSPNSDGLFIDFLDPKATQRYLQYIMDQLGITIENAKEKGLKYYEFDSMELAEGIPWTDRFSEVFKERRGYSPELYLPSLAGWTIANASERFLYDFHLTVSDQLIYSHYYTATKFLKLHGAELVAEAGGPGPPIWNTCPVDALKALGNVSVPRGEFWIKHRNMFLVKQIASASHIYGKKIVDAESFTTWRRWKDSPFAMKRIVDRAFCEGLNFVTLCNYASTNPEDGYPGRTLHAGADFNPGSTWWPKSKVFMDYLSRCSYLLQKGLFVADACYYYGDQAPNFFPAFHDVPEKPTIPGLDEGYDFDVVNSDVILNRMTVEDGRIVLPDGMNYRVMLLPDQEVMPIEILEKLKDLVRDGATIIGHPPKSVPGLKDFEEKNEKLVALAATMWGEADGKTIFKNDYGKGRVIRGLSLTQVLEADGVEKDFEYNGSQEIDFIHRTTISEEIYFVRNDGENSVRSLCSFRAAGKYPELWDPADGTMQRITDYTVNDGVTDITIELPAHGSAFILFTDKSNKEIPQLPKYNVIDEEIIAGPWDICFPAGWGAPEKETFDQLISWTDSPDEGIQYFSGTASYRNKFTVEKGNMNKELFLNLGEMRDVAEVFINGKSAGVLWKKPFVADITDLVAEGENELVVEVTNMWVNRLTGDMNLDQEDRFCSTNHYFMTKERWPGGDEPYRLQQSGLLGPVVLQVMGNITVEN